MESIMEEILEILNIQTPYNQRLSEIDNIINEINGNYPILNLTLLSLTPNYKQTSFLITP